MARPIPHIYLRDLSKIDEDIKPKESKSIFDITVDKLRNNTTRNLVLGTVSGWLAGVTVIRVGKVAAFGLGGGVIIIHFASEYGYINFNWDRIKEAAVESQVWIAKIFQHMKKHSCFSVGFIGGFFFGVASS